jgi:hypothetical protein
MRSAARFRSSLLRLLLLTVGAAAVCAALWPRTAAAWAPPFAPPVAPPAAPAPARPYPPPPPRFEGQPPPFEYPFSPQLEGSPTAEAGTPPRDYRGFNFTLAVGPGGLFGPGEQALALSYLPFRLGYGIAPNLMLVLAFEGVGTSSVNPKTDQDSWLYQDVWSFGLQGRLPAGVYLRGGLGVGAVGEKTRTESFEGGHGLAVLGAVGHEIFTVDHVALALELNAGYTRYPRESWKTMGLQLAVSFF